MMNESITKSLNVQQLEALCAVLADTSRGLSKSELTNVLNQSRIPLADDGHSSDGYIYTTGLNKRNWLFNCFVKEINETQSAEKVFDFIENALNPVLYTDMSRRDFYNALVEETNKVLILMGLSVNKQGEIIKVEKAETLDEADRRVNELGRHLYNRSIHHEVTRFCKKEYLQKDYYGTVFEAAKGLADRVRDMTGLSSDGSTLFQKTFASSSPYLFFNKMKTDSEKSEFNGLRELLEAIFHLVRNPAAHTPKINWKTDENKTLDILTVISFAHKYIDECHKMPGT
jgi:uncharacterized protein (TIGR02391 family)